MKIYKYPLQLRFRNKISLPKGAKILSVGEQGTKVYLWALVDPTEIETEDRIFSVSGTGHDLPYEPIGNFLGTIHVKDLRLVWHVFEVAK